MSWIHLPHDHGQHSQKILEHIPQDEMFQSVTEQLKLLGDGSRLKIFWILCHCEECVINLSAMMEMSSPAVAHHLKLLKTAGLVTTRREGKEVYYKASESDQVHLLHEMVERLMIITCPDIEEERHEQ